MVMKVGKEIEFFLRSDVVVTGHNPEMADYDNRDGSIFGEGFYVVARVVEGTQEGFQWAHDHTFINDQAGAERLLQRIVGASEIDESHWREIEPQYGTNAWLSWNADHPETWND
jgi:hypothetical protein